MAPRISKSTTVTLDGTSITVADLLTILDGSPADASIRIAVHVGEYGQSGYATLTITHE